MGSGKVEGNMRRRTGGGGGRGHECWWRDGTLEEEQGEGEINWVNWGRKGG